MNAREHSKRIVYHSLQLAKPTKAKAKVSMVTGIAVCLVGTTVSIFHKTIGVGIVTAGVLQLGVASIVKHYAKK